jgi:hypothetical protein
MERKHEEFGREKLQQGQQHTKHLQNRSSIQYERGEGVQNRSLLIENGGLYDRGSRAIAIIMSFSGRTAMLTVCLALLLNEDDDTTDF